MKKSIFLFVFCLAFFAVSAQNLPFSRGINLTNWFQADNAQAVQFTRYTKEDFHQIHSLGVDVIRLPINLHAMTDGAPDYTVDPLFYTFMDQVVDWAEELQMHLILDNHTFDPAVNTDPNIGPVLKKVWKQVAAHYQDRSQYLYYEILNEPHGISDALWGSIQGDVIDEIRTVDTTHFLIVGPAGWNSYHNLAAMPNYADDKLIYTFHFYDPFLFTHQGASWTDPSMEPLSGVPFPYQAGSMPAFPPSLNGTWIQGAFNDYANTGTVAQVRNLLDIADQFRQTRNVPLFCGEFGVYIPNSDPGQRVNWYDEVRTYLDSLNIGWTIWDYHGGFGIFEGGSGLFNHDLNVPLLGALGFNVPPQTPFSIKPDSTGFLIYDDFVGQGINTWAGGLLNWYSGERPNYGDFVFSWGGPGQYETVSFDFVPDKDLNYLKDNGYALDLFIRGEAVGSSLDIRFIDTKTGPNERPWRMRTTVTESVISWDKRWHHFRVPLSSFAEHGSWDNNTWHEPQGLFDWTAIDLIEIVAEYQAIPNGRIWFDQMQINNQDTAVVRDTAVYNVGIDLVELDFALNVYPNPVEDLMYVETDYKRPLQYTLVNLQGQTLKQGEFVRSIRLNTEFLPVGMYLLRLGERQAALQVHKVIKR
jgi:endoglucanase